MRPAFSSWSFVGRPNRMLASGRVVGILLGIVLLEERLSRPAWHVVVACIGLGLALVGAVVISLAREVGAEREQRAPATNAATG